MPATARAAAWLAGLVGAAVALRLTATGDLAAPPLTSPGGLVDWVDVRQPAAAAVALVRLGAELAVWYVLAVSTLHVVASGLRVVGARRLADALAVPAVTRLVRAGLGFGVVAASALAPAEPAPPRGTATMTPVPAGGTAVAAPSTGTAAMRPVAPAAPVAEVPARPGPAAPPTTWTVEPGDSLWSIAAEVVSDAVGRPATDGEVDPFWRALVERNRPRLVDPADPDLLHPGQVLELPPLR